MLKVSAVSERAPAAMFRWIVNIYRMARNFRGLKFSRFRGFGSYRENFTLENFTLGLEFFGIVLAPATRTDMPAVSVLIAMALY